MLVSFVAFGLVFAGCSHAPVRTTAPSAVPQAQSPLVRAELRSPDFWLRAMSEPDRVILFPADIAKFNAGLRAENLIVDLSNFPEEYDGAVLLKNLNDSLEKLRKNTLFRGIERVRDPYWEDIKAAMSLNGITHRIKVRYAFVLRRAEQREVPSEDTLTTNPNSPEFDELQNSSFDIAQPLAVLHETRDGKWVYAVGQSSRGWFHKSQVVFCGREQFRTYLSRPFCVVTAAKADIFTEPDLKGFFERCRMGVKLAIARPGSGSSLEVFVPFKDANGAFMELKAYVSRDSVFPGYLPYTPRTVLKQAFKVLDAPYGWGGLRGEQDCSSFMQEVFSTVGIELPRNSADQAKVGQLAADISRGMPGVTLLGMKGHIMLYLGQVNNQPYAIHSVWAYREPGTGGDLIKVIGKVAVTPLTLGEGSQKGSWLKRVNAVKIVQ